MKHIVIALFCLLTLNLKAATPLITFNFADPLQKDIRLTKPINGTYFPGSLQILPGKGKTQYVLANDIEVAGILQVYIGKLFNFYITPGKNYTISFNLSNADMPFNFMGDNANGQYLLNKVNHSNYQSRAAKYAANSASFDVMKAAIEQDAAAEHKQFTVLLQQKKIDDAFFKYALLETDYYYASVWSMAINDHIEEPGFADAWPALFKKYSFNNDAALTTLSYYDYVDHYVSWYKSYLRRKAGITKRYDMRKSNEYLLHWYHNLADSLTGKTQEYMLAHFLNQFITQHKQEPELVDLFNDFKKQHPQSVYLPYLQPGVEQIIAYHAKAGKGLSGESKIMDNYAAINTLDELLAHFKNKTIYVDIWATWCGPCKEEFAYNPQLHQFLKDKNAEIVYVSTDLDERDKEWHDMVNYYQLPGTHVRTSNKLREDLINKLWGSKKSYSIPRYLIVKNGQLVQPNALRPSGKQNLYDQLGQYL